MPIEMIPESGFYRAPLQIIMSTDVERAIIVYSLVTSTSPISTNALKGLGEQPYTSPVSVHEPCFVAVRARRSDSASFSTRFYCIRGVGCEPTSNVARASMTLSYGKQCQLAFVGKLPSPLASLRPFDLTLCLMNDTRGRLSKQDLKACVCVEATGRPPLVLECDCEVLGAANDLEERSVPWNRVVNLIVGTKGVRKIGNHSKWDAWGVTEPIFYSIGDFRGIRFHFACNVRCIVGFTADQTDQHLDAEVGGWRNDDFAMHFAMNDSQQEEPAMRLYEKGVLLQAVGTLPFAPGSEFSIILRDDGVVYSCNNDIVHVSMLTSERQSSRFRVVTRLADQDSTDSDCLTMSLVAAPVPTLFRIPNLFLGPNICSNRRDNGVLRAWIANRPWSSASGEVELVSIDSSRWSFAAMSLCGVVALGALGCAGGSVSQQLTSAQRRIPPFAQLRIASGDSLRPNVVSPLRTK